MNRALTYLTAGLAAFTFWSSNAFAQGMETNKEVKRLGGHYISPIFSYSSALSPGNFRDFWGSSFGGGVRFSRESTDNTRFALRATYRHFGFDSDKFLDYWGLSRYVTLEGSDIGIINLGGEFDINLAGSTYNPETRRSNLDFLVSLGYYRLEAGKATSRNEYASLSVNLEGANKFGVGAGLKAEVATGRGSIPIKIEYENIFAGEQLGILSFDIGYSFYIDKGK